MPRWRHCRQHRIKRKNHLFSKGRLENEGKILPIEQKDVASYLQQIASGFKFAEVAFLHPQQPPADNDRDVPHSTYLPERMGTAEISPTGTFEAGSFQSFTLVY